MSDYPSCGDRRKMSQSELDRDRMITEMHSDLKHLVKNFDNHVLVDAENQKITNISLESLKEFKWKSVGVVGVVLVLLDVVLKVVFK